MYGPNNSGNTYAISGCTFSSNAASGTDATGGAIANIADGTLTVSNSRFLNDSANKGTGIGASSGSVTASDDWWGADGGPTATGADSVTSGVTASEWLDLEVSAGAPTIHTNSSTSLTATVVTATSAGPSTTADAGTILEGSTVTFSPGTVANTSVNPTVAVISNGTAGTTFFSGSTTGMAAPTADLDNANPSTTIKITLPPSLTMTAPPSSSTTNYNQVFLSANGTGVTDVQFQDSTDSGNTWNDVGPVISGTSSFSTVTPPLPDNTYEVRTRQR